MKKTVLFALNGSRAHAALGVRCLATALLEAGFAATVMEGNLRDRSLSLLSRLYEARADVYGFSVYIWNLPEVLTLAEELKALLPHAHIVLGGPEASFATERFTSLPFVDTVITGEGEEAIVTLLTELSAGETPKKLLAGTPDAHFEERGIHYKKGESLPSLLYYESSRGCPFSCAFCLSSATHGVRAKSAEKTLADLEEFEKLDGNFTVKLVDRTFNFNRERAKEIWRGLLSPAFTKCYHFEIAAQLLDEESFAILGQFPAGKIRLEIGLQSTNERVLSAISRTIDPTAMLSASARLLRETNCHVHLDLIAGLPHQSLASFAESFDRALPACHVLQCGFLKLLHGTALRENAHTFGAVYEPNPPYTVLQTDTLSFEEMGRLHAVAELLERMTERGRFEKSLALILSRVPSPFSFFLGFADFLKGRTPLTLQQIPQRELFLLLSEFAKSLLEKKEHPHLSEALRADFCAAEVRKPPHGL